MKFKKIIFSSLLFCSLLAGVISNVEAQDLSKFQALFITKFIDYVNWPEGKNKLVIGVMGNSNVTSELQTLIKSKGSMHTIKKVDDATDAADCDMLFIPASYVKSFSNINKVTAGKNILIISETEELAIQGSIITFYTESDKLKFIINKGAAEARGLKISGNLLTLGKVI